MNNQLPQKPFQIKHLIIYGIFSLGFLYFSYLIICTITTEPIWNSFPDSNDYIAQSKNSLFSLDFYSPPPNPKFSPRPFTIPLFLKMASSNPFYMVLFQRIFYCLCVLIFILTITVSIINPYLKVLYQFLLMYFFTMWDLVGWSDNVLSEFLSTALMFLWFSAIILFYKKPNRISTVFLIVISLFLSFSRDTWPYVIVMFAIINFIIFKLTKKRAFKLNLIFLIFSVFLFIVQNVTSNIGERYKLPVFNSIVGRVSQNDDYIKWFKKRGMPLTEKTVKDFRGVAVDSQEGRAVIYPKYYDGSYVELFEWIKKDGKSTYRTFVITHPDYFFMIDQTKEQVQRIFCTDLHKFGYFLWPERFFLNSTNFFPFFNMWSCLLLIVLLAMLFKRENKIIYLFPIILFILFLFNALLSYNADTLEVERHLYTTQIVLELISFMSIFLLIDFGIVLLKTKNHLDKQTT